MQAGVTTQNYVRETETNSGFLLLALRNVNAIGTCTGNLHNMFSFTTFK